MKVITETRRAH